MPLFFWISLICGYLVGVGGAVLANPVQIIAPLTPYLVMSCMGAFALLVWLIVQSFLGRFSNGALLETGGVALDFNAAPADHANGPLADEKTPTRPGLPENPDFRAAPSSVRPSVRQDPAGQNADTEPDDLPIEAKELAALMVLLDGGKRPDRRKVGSADPNDPMAGYRAQGSKQPGTPATKLKERIAYRSAEHMDRTGRILDLPEPGSRKKSGPDLALDDILHPQIMMQPIRRLPQRRLTMVDFDIRSNFKARKFWREHDPQRLLALDMKTIEAGRQALLNMPQGHLAQAVCINIEAASLTCGRSHATGEPDSIMEGLRGLASLISGAHLRAIVFVHDFDRRGSHHGPEERRWFARRDDPVVADFLAELQQSRARLPKPLEFGVVVSSLSGLIPEELMEADIQTLKVHHQDMLPADGDDALDHGLCLQLDGMNAKDITLVVAGIDRNQTLLNLLDYPVVAGQGLTLGSELIEPVIEPAAHRPS